MATTFLTERASMPAVLESAAQYAQTKFGQPSSEPATQGWYKKSLVQNNFIKLTAFQLASFFRNILRNNFDVALSVRIAGPLLFERLRYFLNSDYVKTSAAQQVTQYGAVARSPQSRSDKQREGAVRRPGMHH